MEHEEVRFDAMIEGNTPGKMARFVCNNEISNSPVVTIESLAVHEVLELLLLEIRYWGLQKDFGQAQRDHLMDAEAHRIIQRLMNFFKTQGLFQ